MNEMHVDDDDEKQIDDDNESSRLFSIDEISNRLNTAAELSRHFLFENRVVMARKPLLKIPRRVRDELVKNGLKFGVTCYQCCRSFKREHPVYTLLCRRCGDMNHNIFLSLHNKNKTKHVEGMICYVSGGRTKIGYQTALCLLRNGAIVVITSRFPDRATQTYLQEHDSSLWIHNLRVFPESFDLNKSNCASDCENGSCHSQHP